MVKIGTDLREAAHLLTQNKLVAIPTETVYGLAANALSEAAVLSVFKSKNRPFFDPLIIHLPSIDKVNTYTTLNNESFIKLAENFWPGPLTLLLPKKNNVPDIVTSGLNLVGVRVPQHALTLKLLRLINFPLAAPSANPFGYISPTSAQHVYNQLGNRVDYIIDGGECTVGLESTIVGCEEENICIYRLGGLTVEEIEKVVGKVKLNINLSGNPKTPGQLKSHYAPKKPLFVGNINLLLKENSGKKIGIICFGYQNYESSNTIVYNLSKKQNINEAALNLFSYLRLADNDDTDIVICELLPEEGLGLAINDRLRRAAIRE